MKLLYIGICDEESSPGIFRKINGVVKGANRNGYKASAAIVKPGRWAEFVFTCFRAVKENSNGTVMIRYAPNYAIFFILLGLFSKFKKVRLIIDIPTPIINHIKEIYISERSLLFKFIYLSSIFLMSTLPFVFANKLISYAPDSKFFIPSFINNLIVGNGVDIDEWSNDFLSAKPDRVRIVCVGAIAPWHGWDKLLESLSRVEQEFNKSVELHICGGGSELENLKKLVAMKQIVSNVVFHGNLGGDALKSVYHQSDVAIGSLAWERVSVEYASPIKSREYLANGLPFIFKTHDPDLSVNCPYAHEVNSLSELDDALVTLVNQERPSKLQIHDWCREHLDFTNKVKKILS